jgi:hypothetical protein
MQKTILSVHPMTHGHLKLEFTDGSSLVVFRGEHEPHAPKKGDPWPPAPAPAGDLIQLPAWDLRFTAPEAPLEAVQLPAPEDVAAK